MLTVESSLEVLQTPKLQPWPRACGDLMLHVRHETGSNRLVVGFEGLLNNAGVDSIVRAVALIPVADMVVLNLGKATSIGDRVLVELADAMVSTGRLVHFQGLRLHQERLLGYFKRSSASSH
jgi:hypothetical protein